MNIIERLFHKHYWEFNDKEKNFYCKKCFKKISFDELIKLAKKHL